MNPNARTFSFNPNAQGFAPPGQQQQQQQGQQQGGQQQGGQPYGGSYQQQGFQQQGFQQQGFNGAYAGQQYGQYQNPGAYGQQSYNQGYAQQGFTGQTGGYQPRGGNYHGRQTNHDNNNNQHQNESQNNHLPARPSTNQPVSDEQSAPRKPVSMSIGGASKPAADAPRKPISISIGGAKADKKPVSISIGVGAKPAAQETKPAAGAEAALATTSESKPETVAPVDSATPDAAPSQPAAVAASGAGTPSTGSTSAVPSLPESPAPKKAAGKPTGGDKSTTNADQILAEAQKVTDEETMRDLFGDKSDDLKSHLNIVFIGHVDAGKSTMGGNILFLTGMVDKRTLEKYEREAKEAGRESWYLSWALDSTQQEREKGKTVEVGRAYFETGKRRYTILDAPGHKSFVPHMISGASQADIAVLVISARKGEFETGFERGGQTREHAVLVKTAGVQQLIVVVNKMDEPTVQWQKTRYDEIQGKLTPFLRSAGFNPKTDVTYIPVSAFAGQNLKERVSKEVCDWYDGPSLIEYLDNLSLGDRKISSPLKMPISEKYSDMGTVIVGKLEAGKIKKGDTLLLMPNKTSVEAVSIYNEQEEEVPAAISGDNVRVKLKGIDHEDVSVGFVLSDPREPVHVTSTFEAQLAILEHRNIICAGYSAVMHCHTASEEVNLTALLHYYDKKTGKKSKKGPQFAKKGMKIIALIQTSQPVCVERFKDYPQLGRFTLRDEGRTIAIGKITKLVTSEELPDVSKLNIDSAGQA